MTTMPTITIELADEQAKRLEAKALDQKKTVEELAKSAVLDLLAPEEEFEAIAQYVTAKHAELLRRLA
jgi:hypothetical protein